MTRALAPRRSLVGAILSLGLLSLQGCFYYLEPDPNALAPAAAAPAFALAAAGGGPPVTLDALRAQGHVVLVFYRGHW